MECDTIEKSLAKFLCLLATGGKGFVVADSSYLATLTRFLPGYERRKAAAVKWRGLVENMPLYWPNEVAAEIIPKRVYFLDVV